MRPGKRANYARDEVVMVNWKNVAADRLAKCRILERTLELTRADIERKARRAIERSVHATCLASLSHPTTKAMIDGAVSSLVRDLNLDGTK